MPNLPAMPGSGPVFSTTPRAEVAQWLEDTLDAARELNPNVPPDLLDRTTTQMVLARFSGMLSMAKKLRGALAQAADVAAKGPHADLPGLLAAAQIVESAEHSTTVLLDDLVTASDARERKRADQPG